MLNNIHNIGSLSDLQRLKVADHHDLKTRKEVASQFEALFIQEMLKTMRATITKSDLFNSDSIEQYQSLFDQQISMDIANKGIGLRDLIMQQLNDLYEDNNSLVK